MSEGPWVRRYTELRTPAALEQMWTVLRGADAMGLYWKAWRDGGRLYYVVGPSRDIVLGGSPVPVARESV